MRKIGLTGKAHLAGMHPGGIDVGTIDDIQIRFRMVLTNFIYDIVYSDQIWSLGIGCCSLIIVRWLPITGCCLPSSNDSGFLIGFSKNRTEFSRFVAANARALTVFMFKRKAADGHPKLVF